MKTHRETASTILALCCLSLGSLIVLADKPIPLPTTSSASGIWIGYGEHKCFRLELDEDGTGYFAMTGLLDDEGRFTPHTGKIHRITKWRPNGYHIEVELQTLTNGEERIFLTNSSLGGFSMDMDLEVSQGTSKFKVTLYNEAELRARTEKMKEGIDAYRKKGKQK